MLPSLASLCLHREDIGQFAGTGPLGQVMFEWLSQRRRQKTTLRKQRLWGPGTGMVARRRTREQGRALELLGHAVEYLLDDRLFRREADRDGYMSAVLILSEASRRVYRSCSFD